LTLSRQSLKTFFKPSLTCFFNRTNLGSEVDIGDLTWEQKEQVLRALFLRMNTKKSNIQDPSMHK